MEDMMYAEYECNKNEIVEEHISKKMGGKLE